LEIILNFFVEYHNEKTNKVIRNPSKIFISYIKGAFIIDLIQVIPFARMFKPYITPDYNRLFYLIKLTRLFNCFKMLDYKQITIQLKHIYNERL